jgi:hypothetical protein
VGQDKKVEYGIFKAVKLHCDVVVNPRAGSSQEISMFCSTLV